MVQLLRQAGRTKGCRTLEVGGGGSRILPYLGRKFGFQVIGSDFSWRGCVLLKANLSLQGVNGGVVCEDLIQSSLATESFDLVYSQGLIEHFDDILPAIMEHVRLLKEDGRLVLVVPNLQGVQGQIFAKLAPPLWQAHHVFGPSELGATLTRLGLQDIQTGYLGSFNILIGFDPRWTAFRKWPRVVWFLVHASVRVMSGLISFVLRLSPWRPHSRLFSPAFFAVATKPHRGFAHDVGSE